MLIYATLNLLILHIFTIYSIEVKEKIYYEIPSKAISHCVRRLNSTYAVGCSSKSDGNVGIVNVAFNATDLISKLSLLKENTVFIINTSLFLSVSNIGQIQRNHFVTGLIVFDEKDSFNSSRKPFSEDYKNPNALYSYSVNHTYNSPGTEYAFKNWPFPVALIGKRYISEQKKIIDCYEKFNVKMESKRRCAIEIKNFMAAVNSAQTCIKYQNIQNRFAGLFHPMQFCHDFNGMSYIVYTKNSVKSRPVKSVIALITRMDSLSMFEKSATAVNGAVTSTALLLSVMSLLKSQSEFQNQTSSLKKDVLFLFLDNESYDYLGSNRFFWDLNLGKIGNSTGTAINTTHLDLLLEFGEMGFVDNPSEVTFFYPYFKNISDRNRTFSYIESLSRYFREFGFEINSTLPDLPPSSVQYFLREASMPAIVMADHKYKFRNSFYNSFLDDKQMENNSQLLTGIVNAVASFVFQEATGKNLTVFMKETDSVTPWNIIDCFTKNIGCSLLKKVLTTKNIEKLTRLGTPIPTQAHSATEEVASDYRFSFLLRNLIVYLSGEKINNGPCKPCSTCTDLVNLTFGNDTMHCYRTLYDDQDEFSVNDTSSFWVISSIVDEQSVRMFVQAPNAPLLITGIVLTILMTTILTVLHSRMSEIFQV